MSRIFLTGDTHGDVKRFSTDSFKDGNELSRDDYVIILGDFGLIWENYKKDKYWLKWLNEKPWTTLFVDGNHENFDLLLSYPEVDLLGGRAGKIKNGIYHLKRGNVFTINNKTFFVFGGGLSIDKYRRREFTSWWSQEEPNDKEYKLALSNLEKYSYTFDYILTHDTTTEVRENMFDYSEKTDYQLVLFFNEVFPRLQFTHHYFGHHHENKTYKNHTCLYKKIMELNI